MKSFAERQAEKEAQRIASEKQRQERHDSFIQESISELGLNLLELDDAQLKASIEARIRDVSAEIAEHEYKRSFSEVLRDENRLSGDDLIQIMVDQNWIIIQQNERIARLLSREGGDNGLVREDMEGRLQ